MDFHFLVMEKSWKINVEKEGALCYLLDVRLCSVVAKSAGDVLSLSSASLFCCISLPSNKRPAC